MLSSIIPPESSLLYMMNHSPRRRRASSSPTRKLTFTNRFDAMIDPTPAVTASTTTSMIFTAKTNYADFLDMPPRKRSTPPPPSTDGDIIKRPRSSDMHSKRTALPPIPLPPSQNQESAIHSLSTSNMRTRAASATASHSSSCGKKRESTPCSVERRSVTPSDALISSVAVLPPPPPTGPVAISLPVVRILFGTQPTQKETEDFLSDLEYQVCGGEPWSFESSFGLRNDESNEGDLIALLE